VQVPAMIVKKEVGDQLHVLHIGQQIEQGIAGGRNQDLSAWVAQQAEQEGVALARAGGEHDVVGINNRASARTAVGVIRGNSFARVAQSSRVGFITQGLR